jgi:hypothetical protein
MAQPTNAVSRAANLIAAAESITAQLRMPAPVPYRKKLISRRQRMIDDAADLLRMARERATGVSGLSAESRLRARRSA